MQPNVHSFKRPELRIPGNDCSVWVAEPVGSEARPSAAVNELEDYHEVKALSAHSATQINKKITVVFG